MRVALFSMALLGLVFSGKASAVKDPVFGADLGLIYQSAAVSAEGDSTSVTTTGMNFHAGFFPFSNFMVGLAHYSVVEAVSFSRSSGSTTATFTQTGTTSGQGLFLGFLAPGGFHAGLSFLVNPTFVSDDTEFSGGTAMILQAGWLWTMGHWKFGFSMVRSEFGYTTQTSNGIEVDLPESRTDTLLTPMGNIGFYL